MNKYECRYIEQSGHKTNVYSYGKPQLDELTAAINDLGSEGWELVTVVPCSGGGYGTAKLVAFLRREIEHTSKTGG